MTPAVGPVRAKVRSRASIFSSARLANLKIRPLCKDQSPNIIFTAGVTPSKLLPAKSLIKPLFFQRSLI